MIVLLSPAKTMNAFRSANVDSTRAMFLNQAKVIVTEIQKLSQSQLRSMLSVSEPLAKLNNDRYKQWGEQKSCPAILAFDGHAYKGLDASGLGDDDLIFLQGRLRILCGLYGVLRPLDNIEPYRLEMGAKFEVGAAKNLYAFWRDTVTSHINSELEAMPVEERFVVNCASQEYFKAVDTTHLIAPIFTMAFRDSSTVYVKKARGAMVRYIVQRRAVTPADLQGFTGNDGEWAFVASESSEDTFVFVRGAAVPAPQKESKAAKSKKSGARPVAKEDQKPAQKMKEASASKEQDVSQPAAPRRQTRQATSATRE